MSVNKNSIIAFPDSFTVIDLETTGFSCNWDEIIEIGAIKIQNDIVVETFSSLICPFSPIDTFISELTGITNKMLKGAPSIEEKMPQFLDFIGNDIIVGHNVGFDLAFVRCNSYTDFEREYIDTMRLSRKLFPNIEHHRLSDMVKHLDIPCEREHRALDDCKTTLYLYRKCHEEALMQYGDIESFRKIFKPRYNGKSGSRIDISSIVADQNLIDEDCLFFDRECVFTGTLEKMKRADAMQLVVNIGGRVANSVTKKTNFLILGNNDYCKSIKDGKSSKHKKAEQLKLKGQDIEVISEQTFYDALDI